MGRVLVVLLVVVLIAGTIYGFVKLYTEAAKWNAGPQRPRRPWELD
jgi:hypothetical protein